MRKPTTAQAAINLEELLINHSANAKLSMIEAKIAPQ